MNRNDAAAVLWGWIGEAGYGVLRGHEDIIYERDLAEILDAIEAERFKALTEQGAAMTYEEIIKYTLDETEEAMSRQGSSGFALPADWLSAVRRPPTLGALHLIVNTLRCAAPARRWSARLMHIDPIALAVRWSGASSRILRRS